MNPHSFMLLVEKHSTESKLEKYKEKLIDQIYSVVVSAILILVARQRLFNENTTKVHLKNMKCFCVKTFPGGFYFF